MVGEISDFKFDAYRVGLTGANDLKLFAGGALQWHHNDGVSYHQPHDCLLNRLFKRRSKKISKLHVTGLCAGNSPVTGEFPAQRASNAENISIWWHHHVYIHVTHNPNKQKVFLYFSERVRLLDLVSDTFSYTFRGRRHTFFSLAL